MKKKWELLPRLADSKAWLYKNRSVFNNKEFSPSLVKESTIISVRESVGEENQRVEISRLFQRKAKIVAQEMGLVGMDPNPIGETKKNHHGSP